MTKRQLAEYLIKEQKLRGVIVWEDPLIRPVVKKYTLPEKYLRKPLWCIKGQTLGVTGVIIFNEMRAVYEPKKRIFYEWEILQYFPVKDFPSPLTVSRPAPTISFNCPHPLNESLFIGGEPNPGTFTQFLKSG